MGDLVDSADVSRFMRSYAGELKLEEIRAMLLHRSIEEVTFTNEVQAVGVTLRLDSGESLLVLLPELDLGALRHAYAEVLQEEYYRDFPERRPKEES